MLAFQVIWYESERSLNVSTGSLLPSPTTKGVSLWFRNLAVSPEIDLYVTCMSVLTIAKIISRKI